MGSLLPGFRPIWLEARRTNDKWRISHRNGSRFSQTSGHRLADVYCDATVMKSGVTIDFSVDVARTNVHPVAGILLDQL